MRKAGTPDQNPARIVVKDFAKVKQDRETMPEQIERMENDENIVGETENGEKLKARVHNGKYIVEKVKKVHPLAFMSVLKVRATGLGVEKLQKRLEAMGYYFDDIDGFYGYKTMQAVTDYQKSAGLEPTGEVDAKTHNKLYNPPEEIAKQNLEAETKQKKNGMAKKWLAGAGALAAYYFFTG